MIEESRGDNDDDSLHFTRFGISTNLQPPALSALDSEDHRHVSFHVSPLRELEKVGFKVQLGLKYT